MTQTTRKTHLEYYREHEIAPVRYDITCMDAHLQKRASLYTMLGVLPLTISKSRILEVAAGTGHNSVFLAQCMPKELVLLEPNQSGIEHINQVYEQFDRPHTKPKLICQMLEDYFPLERFDIVICENWLGTSTHERYLLKKLMGFVDKQGVLVLTTVSPIGFVPNLLRRFFSVYLSPVSEPFEKRTSTLVEAFHSHLNSLSAMTRSNIDWVQDNMINPAYFGLCLSIPDLIESVSNEFEFIGASPSFCEDWRWFKSLASSERKFNQQYLREYNKKSHNLLDHLECPNMGEIDNNVKLELSALRLLDIVARHEDAHIQGDKTEASWLQLIRELNMFISLVPFHMKRARDGLLEAAALAKSNDLITVSTVSKMKHFSHLFGRETVYVSMMRDR